MTRPTTATPASESGAEGPYPFEIASPARVRSRRALAFALLGLATYLIALLASLPARMVLGEGAESAVVRTVSGTIWSGEAALAEGHAARWTWSPLGSLVKLGFAADLAIEGPDTALAGELLWRPGTLRVTELKGNADGALVNALAPRLPFRCGFAMQVALERLTLRGQQAGAEGSVRTTGGECALKGAPSGFGAVIPPLAMQGASNAGGNAGWIAPQGNQGARWVNWAITPSGRLSAEVSPTGAAALPGGGIGVPRSFSQQL